METQIKGEKSFNAIQLIHWPGYKQKWRVVVPFAENLVNLGV
jgi:hypothetical protein